LQKLHICPVDDGGRQASGRIGAGIDADAAAFYYGLIDNCVAMDNPVPVIAGLFFKQ